MDERMCQHPVRTVKVNFSLIPANRSIETYFYRFIDKFLRQRQLRGIHFLRATERKHSTKINV